MRDLDAYYPKTNQSVSFTGTSAASSAIGTNIELIRLVASQDCFIAIGSAPTASSSSTFLPANVVEYFQVPRNSKIAAIQSSTAGTLYLSEMVSC